jgi:hypothetical protein
MYRFKGRATEKDVEGYYYPRWDRAKPFAVTASNEREAMRKAAAALGSTRSGFVWVFRFESIEETVVPDTKRQELAVAWNLGMAAGIAWAQGKAEEPLSNPYETKARA